MMAIKIIIKPNSLLWRLINLVRLNWLYQLDTKKWLQKNSYREKNIDSHQITYICTPTHSNKFATLTKKYLIVSYQ